MNLFHLPFTGFVRISPGRRSPASRSTTGAHRPQNHPETLAKALPGARVQVGCFAAGIAPQRLAHLQAYGLTPGCWLKVVQHAPVTIVQIEHLELALETELAEKIIVQVES